MIIGFFTIKQLLINIPRRSFAITKKYKKLKKFTKQELLNMIETSHEVLKRFQL